MRKFTAAEIETHLKWNLLGDDTQEMLRELATLLAERERVHSDHPLRHYDRTCPACNAAPSIDRPTNLEGTAEECPPFAPGLKLDSRGVLAAAPDLANLRKEGKTPRTDSFKRHYDGGDRANSWDYVDVEDCESLERELAAMTKQCDKHMAAVAAYNEDCKAAEAELATLQKDAERYRWLRQRVQVRNMQAMNGSYRKAIDIVTGMAFFDSRTKRNEKYIAECAAELDAAIDAAKRLEKEGK